MNFSKLRISGLGLVLGIIHTIYFTVLLVWTLDQMYNHMAHPMILFWIVILDPPASWIGALIATVLTNALLHFKISGLTNPAYIISVISIYIFGFALWGIVGNLSVHIFRVYKLGKNKMEKI